MSNNSVTFIENIMKKTTLTQYISPFKALRDENFYLTSISLWK